MKYIIYRKEIYSQAVEIEAETIGDAIDLVEEGKGTEKGKPQHVNTDDPETWDVEEVKE